MSTATHAVSFREARELAAPLIELLRPHCERVEIAGSIRRCKTWINDIEIVCVPKTLKVTTPRITREADLFAPEASVEQTELLRVPGFVNTVNDWQMKSVDAGHQAKPFGDPWKGRYVKLNLPSGIQVDLFITTPENWGYIFLIRTGSADFTKMIASRWVQLGHKGVEGELTRNGLTLHFREEGELFAHLGMRTPPPTERELTVDGISKWIIK